MEQEISGLYYVLLEIYMAKGKYSRLFIKNEFSKLSEILEGKYLVPC